MRGLRTCNFLLIRCTGIVAGAVEVDIPDKSTAPAVPAAAALLTFGHGDAGTRLGISNA
jgi:hypothetical protein